MDQRLLYRRIEHLLLGLRSSLEAAGFGPNEAIQILDRPDVEFGSVFDRAEKNSAPRPSTPIGDAEEGRA